MKQCKSCKKIYPDKYSRCPYCGSFSRSKSASFLLWLCHNVYLGIIKGSENVIIFSDHLFLLCKNKGRRCALNPFAKSINTNL